MSEVKDIPELPEDSAERLVYKPPRVLSMDEIAGIHPILGELFSAEGRALTADLALLGEKSAETHAHSVNVAQLGIAIAIAEGYEPSLQRAIARAALLHDVGKVLDHKVTDLVHKEQGLTLDEKKVLNTHTELGYAHLIGRDPFSAVIARFHHQPLDGYPTRETLIPSPEMQRFVDLSAVIDVISGSTDPRIYRLRPVAPEIIIGRVREKLPDHERIAAHALSVYTSPNFRKATA